MKFHLQTPADPFNPQGPLRTREVHDPETALREQYSGATVRLDRTNSGDTKRWIVTSPAGQTLHAYSWGCE